MSELTLSSLVTLSLSLVLFAAALVLSLHDRTVLARITGGAAALALAAMFVLSYLAIWA